SSTREHAQHCSRSWAQTGVKRDRSASDCENTHPDSVKTGDESPVVNNFAIPQENQDSCHSSNRKVAPVIQCRRRCVAEDYVPHDPPAQPSRYRKHEDSEEVHLLPNCQDSSTEAESESSHQIER